MKTQTQKVSMAEKIGYSLGDGSANLIFQMMMMFQLFFYTDVFGIKATAAGMILLSGNSAVPKGLQDVQRYTLVNKEKNGSLALVWVYTFTNADYEAAKARGAVHITLGEI